MSPRDRVDGAAPAADAGREPRSPSRLWWATRPGLALKAGVVILAAGLVLTGWLILRPPPGEIQRPPAPAEMANDSAAPGTSGTDSIAAQGAGPGQPAAADPAGGHVIVHVAGAVAEPGLVTLTEGARIADAIEAAGGPTSEAVLGAVNLAAPARDGEQVYVPTEEDSPPPSADGAGPRPEGSADAPIDLNRADAAALETLPGVGPVTAERILAWRTEHGPFASVADLLAVPGIGPATLARLEDRVRT